MNADEAKKGIYAKWTEQEPGADPRRTLSA